MDSAELRRQRSPESSGTNTAATAVTAVTAAFIHRFGCLGLSARYLPASPSPTRHHHLPPPRPPPPPHHQHHHEPSGPVCRRDFRAAYRRGTSDSATEHNSGGFRYNQRRRSSRPDSRPIRRSSRFLVHTIVPILCRRLSFMSDGLCFPDYRSQTCCSRPPPQIHQDGRQENRPCGDHIFPHRRRHRHGGAVPRPARQEYSKQRVRTLEFNLAWCDGPSVTIETTDWVLGWSRPPTKSTRRTLYATTTRPPATH